jgi:hypothetical protein
MSSSTKALSKQLLGVRAVLRSKNALTPQTLLEMDVKPASRTGGVAFPMKCLKSRVLSKFTGSASITSRTWSKPLYLSQQLRGELKR